MTRRERELRAVVAAADAEIDGAYWRFCRMARALPPVLAVPEAYRRRAEAEAALAELRGAGAPRASAVPARPARDPLARKRGTPVG